MADLRRKLPWYVSDYKDGLHIQCIASLFFMYFACLAPIITFGGLLGSATNNNIVSSLDIDIYSPFIFLSDFFPLASLIDVN